MSVLLHVWGEYACFTRPEMKAERVSYDVITPSAARGILEAIYWKPSIVWRIEKIYVLKPIQFVSIRRNEVGKKMVPFSSGFYIEDEREQRNSLVLRDVAYVIQAHFDLTQKAGSLDENDKEPGKHLDIFKRRAQKGQFVYQPYLGTREFPAHFRLVEDEKQIPVCELPDEQKNKDLGWMLYDIDYTTKAPRFFRAKMENGVIILPSYEEVFV